MNVSWDSALEVDQDSKEKTTLVVARRCLGLCQVLLSTGVWFKKKGRHSLLRLIPREKKSVRDENIKRSTMSFLDKKRGQFI